jgi:hypothetical protein
MMPTYVDLMEEEAAVGFEGLLDHGVFPPGDEDGDELIAAFADLFAKGFDVEEDVDDGESVSPCSGVEPVAFDEGSVDVGEDGFYWRATFGSADGGLDAVRASRTNGPLVR